MVSLTCPQCGRTLEYSGAPPSFCAYCGTRLNLAATADLDHEARTAPREDAAGPAEAPEQVGGYRLLRPLGAGGMGSVYEAEEVASGRRVALKLIAPDVAASPQAVERFRQEGRLASAIAHPRCVFVLAADEEAGRPYIVMELMPGDTLETLVQKRGPLPPEQAVARILDVIDGLREAHRLGVVHRDIKPSNCFLEADGRVKVGDFGLAKSLVGQAHLTKTGTFLGTLLYCSPEQVRGQPVDAQSDVYSVAATLYFLLAGQAPFQTDDAAAAVARIVADPVPPLRAVRKEVPAALEQVVLRGLERDRQRRWRGLDDFRAALLPFAPGRLSIGGVGLRFGAYLLDALVLAPLAFMQSTVVMRDMATHNHPLVIASTALVLLVGLAYYAVLEGLWGCTLGKRWLRLRVWTAGGSDPPGLARGLLRTGTWLALASAPGALLQMVFDPAYLATQPLLNLAVSSSQIVLLILGVGLMVCTMRARNGYRCLHDILSGTRVVRLPEPERRLALPGRGRSRPLLSAECAPHRLGGFAVRGELGRAGRGRVLLGEDLALGREVLLWVRPAEEPPVDPARHECNRGTRLRWLATGRDEGARWDAYLAPTGSSLPDLAAAGGPVPWAVARPVLEQLTGELAAAGDDGTRPPSLGVEQVWVQENGQVVLLDVPLGDTASAAATGGRPGEDERAALALLGAAAVLLLEGRPRPADTPPRPAQAPLPGYAARVVERLLPGAPCPYGSVKQLQADLAATRDQPAEVTRARRAAHLAVQAAFLGLGGLLMMIGGCLPSFVPAVADSVRAGDANDRLERLAQQSGRDFVVSSLGPSPAARLAALALRSADLRLADRLDELGKSADRKYQARLASMSWPMRGYTLAVEQQVQSQVAAEVEQRSRAHPAGHLFFARAHGPLVNLEKNALLERSVRNVAIAFVLAGPLLWVLWAFLLRGGLSFRLLGLSLVRDDGRPAERWRCAGRALIIWGPVAVLLTCPLWLDHWYWSNWDGSGRHAWVPWLSLATWWGVWAWLGLNVGLALRSPARALHDRLAGTYLVPR
jgi:hypothetical protein